jgi:hypothetical protein
MRLTRVSHHIPYVISTNQYYQYLQALDQQSPARLPNIKSLEALDQKSLLSGSAGNLESMLISE